MSWILAACAAPLAIWVAAAEPASADVGALTPAGCIQDADSTAACDASQQGLDTSVDVAVSPDGRSVYVVSHVEDTIVRFARDMASGALTPQGCHRDFEATVACGSAAQGLDGAAGVAVSPDGTSVYVVSQGDDAIARFDRNTTTGALMGAGCIQDTGRTDCAAQGDGLDRANGVAVSPDGSSVYVASYDDDAIVRFDRDTTTGALTWEGCFCGTAGSPWLDGATDVAASSDGTSVYVVARSADAVVRYNRTSTGSLAAPSDICIEDDAAPATTSCPLTEQGLDGPTDVAVSPDSRSVYTVSASDDALVRFNRDTMNGSLTGRGCIQDAGKSDCGSNQQGLNLALGVAVSPDGSSVYVASDLDRAVARFDRSATGALTGRGCIQDLGSTDCGRTTEGLDSLTAVAVSGDGASVYTTSQDDSTIAHFRRELPSGAGAPGGDGATGGDEASADTTRPELTLRGKKVQRLRKQVKVKARCNEDCAAVARGRLAITKRGGPRPRAARSRKLRLKPVRIQIAATERAKLKLKLRRKTRRIARRGLRRGRKVVAKLKVKATDGAGNSTSERRKVRLKLRR